MADEQKEKAKKPRLLVYAVSRSGGDKKDFFDPCGSGFRNEKDGSLTIVLQDYPLYTPELHARAPKDEKPCWTAMPMGRYRVFQLPGKAEEGKPQWREIGKAFGNRDGSLRVILKYIPTTNRLNIRLPKEAE
ncbi:MAG: hypothetical protein Q8P84_09570 [Deltaproteobacteria bacterium]|nr:hypothetical protein [Deltaproteobacteria bacterium]